MVQTGCKHVWIWITIELVHKSVLGSHISEERNMFVEENFIHSLVNKYGKHTTTQMVVNVTSTSL